RLLDLGIAVLLRSAQGTAATDAEPSPRCDRAPGELQQIAAGNGSCQTHVGSPVGAAQRAALPLSRPQGRGRRTAAVQCLPARGNALRKGAESRRAPLRGAVRGAVLAGEVISPPVELQGKPSDRTFARSIKIGHFTRTDQSPRIRAANELMGYPFRGKRPGGSSRFEERSSEPLPAGFPLRRGIPCRPAHPRLRLPAVRQDR